MRKRRTIGHGILLGLLAGVGTGQAQQTPAYSGPQAVVYIGENSCSGGYCGNSVWAAFDSAITQAMTASGYVRAVRKPDGANLVMKAGISSVTGGGGVCLPLVGCLDARTVRANLELDDAATGTVVWRDSCEGTSAGYSSWYWWSGVTFNSDDDKAAADCAGKLVQRVNGSAALKAYLTVAPGAALGTAAPAPVAASAPASGGTVSEAQAQQVLTLLSGALQALSFDDVNALFTSDPINPVSVKALKAASAAATQTAASRFRMTFSSPEDAGAYRVIGVTYTLPDGSEHFTQLAVAGDGPLNTRGGPHIVYLSAFNAARAGTPALDGLSRNVETLLADFRRAVGLP
ncbi:hypothetical protein [Deinococcus sonorensis]|uniref:Uncharacterized protein n=2 Tax=Deinococcus sonorensis TaxID=309891 RepID=A0AAU7U4C9_9DEIO